MKDALCVVTFLIIFAAIGIIKQKYGAQIKMRKCAKEPFYAYFFEDLKDFKNCARINGCDWWHSHEEDCIFIDEFDDNAIRRLAAVMTPTGERQYFASEVLNVCVYFTLSERNTYPFVEEEERRFNRKITDLALEHLRRFNRTEWFYAPGRYMNVLRRSSENNES